MKLADKIKSIPGTVLVDFFQNDCRFCDLLKPQLHEAAETTGAQILAINLSEISADARAQLVDEYSLMSTPTVLIYKDGAQVDRFSGFVVAGAIEAKIIAL